jgi:bifunctional UDP-N-acetylglucosamine pyrophosphorylase / glucosamine-1-phosphate N-acetyltransferase
MEDVQRGRGPELARKLFRRESPPTKHLANVGVGTVTCNYDGVAKHRTEIGADVFVGTNASLVAPIRIEDGAFIAAGSTITEDVPAEAMALGRARQVNKPRGAAAWRARRGAKRASDAG